MQASGDLLIVEALKIVAKMRLRRLVFGSTFGKRRYNTHYV